jgi:hypothetical protein
MTATLAPSAKVKSAGSSSPAPTTLDVSIISDANMAWMLADAANVCLTGYQRTMTFVELGSGENHLAITRILNAVMSRRMTLPATVFDRLISHCGSAEKCHKNSRKSNNYTPLRLYLQGSGPNHDASGGARLTATTHSIKPA